MHLLYSPTSPFVRKVMVVAHELGISNKIKNIEENPWMEENRVHEHNPLGKVPVLIVDNQTILDSKLIVRYLLDMSDNASMLYPPSSIPEQMYFEALGDGICEACANRFLELNRRPPEKQMDYWLERFHLAIVRSLASLEKESASFTNSFTLGAIAIAVALDYIDLRYPQLNWRENHPTLADWNKQISTRHSMKETLPPRLNR